MLTSRIYRHRLALRNGDHEHSAIAEHAIDNGHEINWNKIGIVRAPSNLTERLLLESLYIQSQENAVNNNQGITFNTLFKPTLSNCNLKPFQEVTLPIKKK